MMVLLVAGLAVVVLLLFGAMLELHRQVLQLRQHAGLIDDSRVVDFERDALRSSLPGWDDSLFAPEQRSAILMLSDGCSTCHDIARGLPSPIPPALLVILAARSAEKGALWLAPLGLDGSANVIVDGGEVADRLGLTVTPTVVTFEGLYSVSATTVPSVRQLASIVEWLGGQKAKVKKEVG